MTAQLPPARIEAGMSIESVLVAFRAACNHGPERLFITESWIAPRFDRLRELLTDPVTPEQAEALREIVLKKRRLDDVIEWLEHEPATWQEYIELSRRRATKGWKALRQRGYFPWEDVEACRTSTDPPANVPVVLRIGEEAADVQQAKRHYLTQAVPCSACGASPDELTWIHFTSPEWTWMAMCGREGWLTVCDRCHLQVDYFGEAMN